MTVNASSLIRISVDSGGNSANNLATGGVMSADGRYVVFQSTATNLVGGDVNGFFDVFLRDTLTGTTTLLSTATGGTQGNNVSSVAAVTDDGRFVFFNSTATNLVGGDTNAQLDVFMRDTLTGVTTRVSTASDGSQSNGASQNVDVTASGSHIGFQSTATNLVAGDGNGFSDAFVKNLSTGLVTRISVADDESQGNGNSLVARLSDDGNRASFVSTASNLTANDSNGAVTDVFVRDIAAGTTVLASVSTGGGSGDGQSSGASISGNGRYVVFQSDATNLVAGDTNGTTDIFVRDLQTNTTTRVSTATDGSQGNDLSGQAVISADGRYVVFFSLAGNLVQGDTNGLRDIFLKDLVTGNVTRLSVAADGSQLNDLSNAPSISADGRYVTFQTQATNTGVGAEGNGTGFDVFRISLVASAGADRMIGSDGNDTIDGLAGDDILLGGFGNDTLGGGAGADALTGGGGLDTADYSASAVAVSVNLALGSASGGDAQGDVLTGITNVIGSNAGDDTLTGDASANTLSGQGGNDRLGGGGGNDILLGGSGDDVLIGGEGADSLQGGDGLNDVADYSGSAPVTVNLTTGTGSGGDAQGDTLTGIESVVGTGGNDVIIGSTANNTLDGGAGDDVLDGGAGDDLFRVDSAADQVIEAVGDGTDTVVSTLSYTLGAGQEIEFLKTADALGTTAIDLRGNAFQQTIEGNDGDNTLHDGGTGPLKGDGIPDTLIGHDGDDTYVVYDAEAVIVEAAGEGHDKLASGAHFVLGDDISIEYLSTSSQVATYAIDLTGNNLGQWVRGSNGANVLDGRGGIDTLWGMGGADSFRFSTALGVGNVDRIADFSAADDTIQLDDAIFTALTTLGTLDPSAFKDIGVAAMDADDRILYNSKNGSLFYDADGSGSGSTPIKFAMLSPGLALTAADFVVI